MNNMNRGFSSLASSVRMGIFVMRPVADSRPEMFANLKVEFFSKCGEVGDGDGVGVGGGRGGFGVGGKLESLSLGLSWLVMGVWWVDWGG